MGTINSNDRIAATMYSLGTWFVSGIYVKIPSIKALKMIMMMMPMMMMIIIIIIVIIIIINVAPSHAYAGTEGKWW
jgi:hypothetical protein